jgi:hypothetical protein
MESCCETCEQLFLGITEQQLLQPGTPGRNGITSLLGHLTAGHDAMLPLVGAGEHLHPELDATFITKPDRAIGRLPGAEELKTSASSSVGIAAIERVLEADDARKAARNCESATHSRSVVAFRTLPDCTPSIYLQFAVAILADESRLCSFS